jgi:hypothetical protein
VVIDANRLLTCAHVVMTGQMTRDPLWVAFPRADERPRRRVASVALDYQPPVHDLSVLMLEEKVPAGVQAASAGGLRTNGAARTSATAPCKRNDPNIKRFRAKLRQAEAEVAERASSEGLKT